MWVYVCVAVGLWELGLSKAPGLSVYEEDTFTSLNSTQPQSPRLELTPTTSMCQKSRFCLRGHQRCQDWHVVEETAGRLANVGISVSCSAPVPGTGNQHQFGAYGWFELGLGCRMHGKGSGWRGLLMAKIWRKGYWVTGKWVPLRLTAQFSTVAGLRGLCCGFCT